MEKAATATTRKKRVKTPVCLLCGSSGEPIAVPELKLFWHVDVPQCKVNIFDEHGICRDDVYEIEDEQLYKIGPGVAEPLPEIEAVLAGTVAAATGDIILPASFMKGPWARVDIVTGEIFDEVGVPRLGGISGTRGWSSISTFQRCRYAWSLTYNSGKGRKKMTMLDAAERAGLAVGSIVHTFLAIYYIAQIDPSYPLKIQFLREQLYARGCDPEHVTKAWEVFAAYVSNYEGEPLEPLAVEFLMVDPKTGHSCRYDLIARVTEPTPFLRAGTYVVEHKTSARDEGDNWQNDGELLGQIDLWDRLKLDKRFGQLCGVIANNLIKTDTPKFKRYCIAPQGWQIKDHRKTLAIFCAEIEQAKATGVFPRSRAGCISRYGKCDYYDHCANAEDDLLVEAVA